MYEKGGHLQEDRDDTGGWEDDVERRAGRAASVVFSVRFARDEIAAIRQAAERIGEKTSEFIRIAALKRAHGDVVTSLDMVPSTGAPLSGAILVAKMGSNTQVATPSECVQVA